MRRPAYQEQRSRRNLPALLVDVAGKPATFNVLFCRDPAAERTGSSHYTKAPSPLTVDQILKVMAIYELHGLSDMAVEIAAVFSDELSRRLDVVRAIDLFWTRSG